MARDLSYVFDAIVYAAFEPLDSGRVRQFIVVPIAFVLAIFSNIKVLQAASVETTVVFRSLVPLITSLADYAFMGRHLPSAQSLTGAQSTHESTY